MNKEKDSVEPNLENSDIQIDEIFESTTGSGDNNLESKLSFQLEQKIQNISGIRRLILDHVIKEEYKKSKSEMTKYIEMKKDFTTFIIRTEPYTKHIVDVINTIKTKRQFLKIRGVINRSKQKEIYSSVLEHFDELKRFINKTMEVAKEEELNDLKSTVFVLKVLSLCIFGVFLISFLLIESISMLKSFYVIVDGIVHDTLGKIFSYF